MTGIRVGMYFLSLKKMRKLLETLSRNLPSDGLCCSQNFRLYRSLFFLC